MRLTRTEAGVALQMLRGQGLRPIGEELSMSLSTVNTHVQRVFDRTGTHRQAELVRLLPGGLAATRRPGTSAVPDIAHPNRAESHLFG
ncbi:MAG: hypothetical protein QOJ20_4091 [Mycobacterium sp.]|nr:hypothetical protein [Mycobacterium sp.]MDT5282896.1 hypothetical protein [Mycobacterium sp.]